MSYKNKPLNEMLAVESERFYGQPTTDENILKIECELNQKLAELGITGIHIKVGKYDAANFSVTTVIGNYEDRDKEIVDHEKIAEEIDLDEWWPRAK
jgi:hypothetical protein